MKNTFKNMLVRNKKKGNTKDGEKIKSSKFQKLPIIKLGTHRKMTVFLWLIFISGFIFAIYKNFTAIDTHTVHEKKKLQIPRLFTALRLISLKPFIHGKIIKSI